jgi:endonuclease/exonuclease/phosphatase (EEP) superfamily protein YafD
VQQELVVSLLQLVMLLQQVVDQVHICSHKELQLVVTVALVAEGVKEMLVDWGFLDKVLLDQLEMVQTIQALVAEQQQQEVEIQVEQE